jgi:hypothetical protein
MRHKNNTNDTKHERKEKGHTHRDTQSETEKEPEEKIGNQLISDYRDLSDVANTNCACGCG